MQRLEPVITSLGRLRWEDSQLESTLGYTGISTSKQTSGERKEYDHGKEGGERKRQVKKINRLTYLDEEANTEIFFSHSYWNMYCLCFPKTSWPLLHFGPYVRGRKALTNKSFPSRTLSFCSRYTFKVPTIKAHSGWQGPKTTCRPFQNYCW